MSTYDTESIVTIVVLVGLTCIYLYLLLAPGQPRVSNKPINVVIERDSLARFQQFLKEVKEYQEAESSSFYGGGRYEYFNVGEGVDAANRSAAARGRGARLYDDFFLDPSEFQGQRLDDDGRQDAVAAPLTPSTRFLCAAHQYIVIRAEANYKFLWMHGGTYHDKTNMAATATVDTPYNHIAFLMHPVAENCEGGWLLLRPADKREFVMMVSGNSTTLPAWSVTLGTDNIDEALIDPQYHFFLEEDGYILNKESMGCLNVISGSEALVLGRGSYRQMAARREYSAMVSFSNVNESLITEAEIMQEQEEKISKEQDEELINAIKALPTSKEKRVISFGLYGSRPKYTTGAIRNAELVPIYFPGWICRFYVTSDVPQAVIEKLKGLGSEIESIPEGMGYASGMFWRFMVAADPTVDRFIVRDVDSRLNARDRLAVEEWIKSGYAVHILRDHTNHCIVMNGGMWGGTKGVLADMADRIDAWRNRDEYMADLHFLEEKVWPDIKYKQISHDSYCCDRFPHTRPFPTKRYLNYQHVGQVFDANDEPRLSDIDGFIRGVPVPSSCRKRYDWIYG